LENYNFAPSRGWWKPWRSSKLCMTWLSSSSIVTPVTYLRYHEPLILILCKTSLKGLILIIKSTYQVWYHVFSTISSCWISASHIYSRMYVKDWYQPWYVDLIIRIKPCMLVLWSITDSW
jgi:hypothetical protein